MPDEYLTTREFDRYCEQDTQWKSQLDRRLDRWEDKVEKFITQTSDSDSRLTILESYSERNRSRTTKISAGVSALITAAVTGLLAAFGKK